MRVTGPRVAVLAILDDSAAAREHLTASDIAGRARTRLGSVSTQAVYDVLEVLVDAGLARKMEPAGRPALYEARAGDNHHHLVCRTCGRTVDVDCAVGHAPCLTPSQSAGFVVDEAEVFFWGVCPACVASPAQDATDIG